MKRLRGRINNRVRCLDTVSQKFINGRKRRPFFSLYPIPCPGMTFFPIPVLFGTTFISPLLIELRQPLLLFTVKAFPSCIRKRDRLFRTENLKSPLSLKGYSHQGFSRLRTHRALSGPATNKKFQAEMYFPFGNIYLNQLLHILWSGKAHPLTQLQERIHNRIMPIGNSRGKRVLNDQAAVHPHPSGST